MALRGVSVKVDLHGLGADETHITAVFSDTTVTLTATESLFRTFDFYFSPITPCIMLMLATSDITHSPC